MTKHSTIQLTFLPTGSLAHPNNVSSVPQRSLFRYPGGKTWLVPTIRQWLSNCKTKPHLLIEPFAGGGIVGLTAVMERLVEQVRLIELDENVAAVWKIVLSKDADKLCQKIIDFETTEKNVRQILQANNRLLLQKAFATIIRNRMQHGGIMSPGASLMRAGENGKGLKSRWYPETLCKRIKQINEFSSQIEFLQEDAFEHLHVDRQDTAYFVDPPYTIAGKRLYKHYEVDHALLFKTLTHSKSNVLMTYDDTPEVHRLASENLFQTAYLPMKSRLHQVKNELLIGNQLSAFMSPAQLLDA